MTLIENLPYVEGVLTVPGRPPLSGRFVIDTGSSLALLVAPDVAARENLAAAFPLMHLATPPGAQGMISFINVIALTAPPSSTIPQPSRPSRFLRDVDLASFHHS